MSPPVVISTKRAITTTATSQGPITAPTIEYNINSGSVVPSWPAAYQNPQSFGSYMLFASGHADINGRMIEACTGGHERHNGAGCAGRAMAVTASGTPVYTTFYPEGDITLPPTVNDNAPCFYTPWTDHGGWTHYWRFYAYGLDGTKIQGGTGAVYPPGSVGPENMVKIDDYVGLFDQLYHNFNPATPINIDHRVHGNWTCFFGGGTGQNSRGGTPSAMKVIKPNPNYPSQPQPLWLQHVNMSGLAGPYRMRYSPIIGDWMYWGGCEQGNVPPENHDVSQLAGMFAKFWRIHWPTLATTTPPQVIQEECPPIPHSTQTVPIDGYPGYFSAASTYQTIVADVPRRRIIHMDYNGISVLQIPANHAVSGMQWSFFNPAGWYQAVNRESDNGYTGMRAHHRTDFGPAGQTFVSGNMSTRWSRVRWVN